jgi:hypothetical protein
VDYRALGGRRFIGSPKQPMVNVYGLVDGVYELAQFRIVERLRSSASQSCKTHFESCPLR